MGMIPASVSLTDSASVAHVFKHKSHSSTELVMIDTTSGLSAVSRPTFTLSKLPNKDKNVRKMRIKTLIPHVEAPSGTTAEGYVAEPRKVGESFIVTDVVLHNRASDSALISLRKYHSSLIDANSGISVVDDMYLSDQLWY